MGRKKSNDPPLRGRADYVLSVYGAARWGLEIKAPSEPITQDTIEQAISYARHPEVSGFYAAILNGRRFVMFRNTQGSDAEAIVDIEIISVEKLAELLMSILSPAAIRRDCPPPIVDLAQPLAEGYRSSATITGGVSIISNFEWECDFPLLAGASEPLDEVCRILNGFRSDLTGGSV